MAQAYHKYLIAGRQAQQFDTKVLNDAETILRKKIFSYQRGETSILEVLNAQRTYNEVYTTFNEVEYNFAVSLVELELACGIWDIGL